MIITGSVGWHPFKKWLTVGTGKLASSFEIFEETDEVEQEGETRRLEHCVCE